MASETEDLGELQAIRAFVARIARVALPDEGVINRRDALALIASGVIEPRDQPDHDELTSAVVNGRVRRDVLSQDGPLLAVSEGSGTATVLRVRDLLLDSSLLVRRFATDHLQHLTVLGGLLTHRTSELLGQMHAYILASDEASWIRPAIDLADAIEDDWLLSIAGARQSLVPELNEYWNDYIQTVLQPSAASIQHSCPKVICPSLHSGAINDAVDGLSMSEEPIADLCDRYLELLGHLPLGVDCALGQLLQPRVNGESSGTLPAVLKWGHKCISPVAQYHAAEAVLYSVDALDDEICDLTSSMFWRICLPNTAVPQPDLKHLEWTVFEQLSRYYLTYQELRVPADHGDVLCAMASWLAQRATPVGFRSAAHAKQFSDQVEKKLGVASSDLWDLLGPPMSHSPLRWHTLQRRSVWALSLLTAIRNEVVFTRLLHGKGPGSIDQRVRCLATTLLPAATTVLDNTGYRFSQQALRVLSWIADHVPAHERPMYHALSEGLDWSPKDVLTKTLTDLPVHDGGHQMLLCHGVWQQVEAGCLDGDELWTVASSQSWRQDVWPSLNGGCIQALGRALVDCAARSSPEWKAELPHLIAEVAESHADSEADRSACMAMVLRACGALNAPSALTRLLNGPASREYREIAGTVAENFEAVLPLAGPWAAGKLRAILTELRP